jgi:YidC/Oxa1 family membrane protein insertase
MPILANVIENAFSPLITLFESIMVFIHNNLVGGSWGLAIIGLTVVIRAALVPLTFRQLKSMQEMQRLAPQISALKEKYKEDKQRQQQEIMKFYQENKINPLASCLPLLLQLPVFISLFYMLRSDLKKHICGDQLVTFFNGHPKEALQYHVAGHVSSVAHLPAKFIEKTSCNTVAPHSAKFLFLPACWSTGSRRTCGRSASRCSSNATWALPPHPPERAPTRTASRRPTASRLSREEGARRQSRRSPG